MSGVIVPRKAIGELSKLLAEESGEDFPTIADGEMTHKFVLPAQDLRDF